MAIASQPNSYINIYQNKKYQMKWNYGNREKERERKNKHEYYKNEKGRGKKERETMNDWSDSILKYSAIQWVNWIDNHFFSFISYIYNIYKYHHWTF